MEDPRITIRPYKSSDFDGVQKLILESTMSHVPQFFLRAVRREIFFESVLVFIASLFVLTNLPFYWILIMSFPIVAIGFLCIIWIGHYYKAHYLHSDLKQIQSIYLASDRTCFWVAEAFGEPPELDQVIKYEMNSVTMDGSLRKGQIVGSIAIMEDRGANKNRNTVWVRSRFAVKMEWRNKGIGSKLLDTCIEFCRMKGYDAIGLISAECHVKGRKLYEKKGFQIIKLRHKRILNMAFLGVPMYFMTKPLKEKQS